jgi:sialate O-acetylesterase
MTYFNKKLVGQSGKFPPQPQTAWEKERNYAIPAEIVNFNSQNVIAVRVYNIEGQGGIYKGPVRIKVIKEEEPE